MEQLAVFGFPGAQEVGGACSQHSKLMCVSQIKVVSQFCIPEAQGGGGCMLPILKINLEFPWTIFTKLLLKT